MTARAEGRAGDVAGLVVRPATIADLDAVIALRLALLREYADHPIYGRLRPDAERHARPLFAAQLSAPTEVMFLALREDAAIGILRCVESHTSPLLLPERYAYVSSVYVRPAERRAGVLRQLLSQADRWCRARGLGEMRLHNVGTNDSAREAWTALGFEVVEQVRLRRLP